MSLQRKKGYIKNNRRDIFMYHYKDGDFVLVQNQSLKDEFPTKMKLYGGFFSIPCPDCEGDHCSKCYGSGCKLVFLEDTKDYCFFGYWIRWDLSMIQRQHFKALETLKT